MCAHTEFCVDERIYESKKLTPSVPPSLTGMGNIRKFINNYT